MIESGLPDGLRVALVHDWLNGMRGGEKCLEVFCEIFPEADIFTLLHVPGAVSPTIERHRIRTPLLQRLPGFASWYRWGLPLFPAAIESFDLADYDLVLSSSHCVAKSAVPAPGALSVCYCHTPMRYVWDRFDDYFGGKPLPLRLAIGAAAARLRRWDRATAERVQLWLANAGIVRERIRDYYGVPDSRIRIVHPPVDTSRFRRDRAPLPPEGLESGAYDFVLSALVPYKRIDLAIAASVRAGRHLVVAGKGPEEQRLRELAAAAEGPGRVSFVSALPDAELPAYYAHCRAFLFPGLEDFGITPLEATACGRPVVALHAGGALDTVVEGLNGIFFPEMSVDSLAGALADPRLDGEWDAEAMAAHAAGFSRERYRREMESTLAAAWKEHADGRSGD